MANRKNKKSNKYKQLKLEARISDKNERALAKSERVYPSPAEMAGIVLSNKKLVLSERENTFVNQMLVWLSPSEKQVTWLKSIYMKYGGNLSTETRPAAVKVAKKNSIRHIERYVYAIRPVDGADVVKIGLSTNPQKRLVGLQTGYPFPLKIFISHLCDSRTVSAKQLEAALHKKFKARNTQGEWFEGVTDDEVREAIAKIESKRAITIEKGLMRRKARLELVNQVGK